MCTVHRPVRRDFGSISYFILDGAVKIWESGSEQDNQLLEAKAVGGHSPTQVVASAIRRDQFIYNGEIALIERLVQDMPYDGFVRNG